MDGGQAHAAADRQKDRKTVGGREEDRPVLVGEQARHAAGQSVVDEQEAGEAGTDAASGSEAVPTVPIREDPFAKAGNGPSERHRGSRSRLAPAGLTGRETAVL